MTRTNMLGCCTVIVATGLSFWSSLAAQQPNRPNPADSIEFAKSAVVLTLNYRQGERNTLTDAEPDFTEEGWQNFMKWLTGFLDPQGNPLGSSIFETTGTPAITQQKDGVTYVAVPGTLIQEVKNTPGGISRARYRVLVEVQVGGDPLKVQHLLTRTCHHNSASTPCD